MKIKKLVWFQIAIYFIIATSLSAGFRLGLFDWYNTMASPFGLANVFKSLLEGIGPITAAFVILKISNRKSEISLWGTQTKKSLIMAIIPVLLFTFFGATNDQNLNRHYYGFIIGLSLVLYGMCEEYGWRGYLQNELFELKPFQKSVIVGVLWYAWHLNFISGNTTLLNELMFLGTLIIASWGIGAIAEKTKSIVASACFHILGNMLAFSPLISTAFDNQTRYIIFGLCLITWIYIVNTWESKSVQTANL